MVDFLPCGAFVGFGRADSCCFGRNSSFVFCFGRNSTFVYSSRDLSNRSLADLAGNPTFYTCRIYFSRRWRKQKTCRIVSSVVGLVARRCSCNCNCRLRIFYRIYWWLWRNHFGVGRIIISYVALGKLQQEVLAWLDNFCRLVGNVVSAKPAGYFVRRDESYEH